MLTPIVQEAINKGKALSFIDPVHYPSRYRGRVPLKVKMLTTVGSDLPFFLGLPDEAPFLIQNNEYYVSVNSYGAVTGINEDGRTLGLRPNEFEVIEWHETTK